MHTELVKTQGMHSFWTNLLKLIKSLSFSLVIKPHLKLSIVVYT